MEKEQSIAELRHKDGTPMRKYNSPKLQAIEMENKQTAVEWLIEQLRSLSHSLEAHLGTGDIRVTQGMIDDLEEQAKQMEKEQHGNTWYTALDKYEVRAGNYMRAYEDFDDYFAETYGSKGSDETKTDNI